MENFIVNPIGKIQRAGGETRIVLERAYAPALAGLEGFSHVQVLWWLSACDHPQGRGVLTIPAPYRHAPKALGVFATRSPQRPNPIALDCAEITFLDPAGAALGVTFLDAYDGSPVLDIKPYTPSLDRVERPAVPAWCRHWPGSWEQSGDFDWAGEINE